MDEKVFAAVLDMETTGLDANDEVPLELGIKLINADGKVLATKQSLVFENNELYNDRIVAAMRHEYVGPMHTQSGLWHDLSLAKGRTLTPRPDYSRTAVDESFVAWLDKLGVKTGTVPMMGNSIGSLDRPFCLRHFPALNAKLSYRNIDMSTVRLLLKGLNPSLWENVEPLVAGNKLVEHRVLDDIDNCILEFKVYCEEFLITGEAS